MQKTAKEKGLDKKHLLKGVDTKTILREDHDTIFEKNPYLFNIMVPKNKEHTTQWSHYNHSFSTSNNKDSKDPNVCKAHAIYVYKNLIHHSRLGVVLDH